MTTSNQQPECEYPQEYRDGAWRAHYNELQRKPESYFLRLEALISRERRLLKKAQRTRTVRDIETWLRASRRLVACEME